MVLSSISSTASNALGTLPQVSARRERESCYNRCALNPAANVQEGQSELRSRRAVHSAHSAYRPNQKRLSATRLGRLLPVRRNWMTSAVCGSKDTGGTPDVFAKAAPLHRTHACPIQRSDVIHPPQEG